jgi:AbrB family looped-hinge helix DNA binding protein
MNVQRGKIISGGRLVVPAEFRRALGLSEGDAVVLEMAGDELRVRPVRSSLRRVREGLRQYAPAEGSVSDELIAERRAEARRD